MHMLANIISMFILKNAVRARSFIKIFLKSLNILTDIKTYYRSTPMKSVLYQHRNRQTNPWRKQNQNRPGYIGELKLNKGDISNQWGNKHMRTMLPP